MRIGIDARGVHERLEGVSRYGMELLRRIGSLDQTNQYIIYCLPNAHWLPRFPNYEFREVSISRMAPTQHITMARLLNRDQLDLFHSLFSWYPIGYRGKTLLTVHDLMAARFPWFFQGHGTVGKYAAFLYFRIMMELNLRQAHHLLTVSHFTADDAQAFYPLAGQKTTVVQLGVSQQPGELTPEGWDQVRRGYGLAEPYFLYVGSFKPYKNVGGLLRGFAYAVEHGIAQNVTLALGGGDQRYGPVIRKLVTDLGLQSRVKLLGYVADEHLPALFRGATAFVFPSIFEGFGLPPLEAMASGAAVIASNAASLPEVVSDAGCLVSPTDPASLGQCLIRFASDPELVCTYRKKAIQRAAELTWDRTAQGTVELYKRLLATN